MLAYCRYGVVFEHSRSQFGLKDVFSVTLMLHFTLMSCEMKWLTLYCLMLYCGKSAFSLALWQLCCAFLLSGCFFTTPWKRTCWKVWHVIVPELLIRAIIAARQSTRQFHNGICTIKMCI